MEHPRQDHGKLIRQGFYCINKYCQGFKIYFFVKLRDTIYNLRMWPLSCYPFHVTMELYFTFYIVLFLSSCTARCQERSSTEVPSTKSCHKPAHLQPATSTEAHAVTVIRQSNDIHYTNYDVIQRPRHQLLLITFRKAPI